MTAITTSKGGMTRPTTPDKTITTQTLLNMDLTPTGGTGPFTVSLYEGTLPTGLKLTSGATPRLYGQATITGTYKLIIKIVDSGSPVGTITTGRFTLTVTEFAASGGFASARTIQPTVDTTKTVTLLTNSSGAVTWSKVSGDLSAVGAVLNPSTGVLTIDATGAASEAFIFRATNASGQVADTGILTIDVQAAVDLPDPVPVGPYEDVEFIMPLIPTGGVAPYTFSYTAVSGGGIPSGTGLEVSSDGTMAWVMGTPDTIETISATFTAQDSNGSDHTTGTITLTTTTAPV